MSCRTIDWAQVCSKVEHCDWAKAIVERCRVDFEFWTSALVLPRPDQESEWTHHYFCEDGTRLEFKVGHPHVHRCSKCGREYSGYPWEGAWYTQMNGLALAQMERSALLYHLNPHKGGPYLSELLKIVQHYASQYPQFQVHGVNAGKGRIQPQSLDEAVWINGYFHALRIAGLDRDCELFSEHRDLLVAIDQLATLGIELLQPQLEPHALHNIHCWMLAAIAACADWLNDEALLVWCRDSPYGVNHQIEAGFHGDGLWYEINAGYHYYTLDGLLFYFEAAGCEGISELAFEKLTAAFNNPPKLAYADSRMPAYGDGWAKSYVGERAHLAEAACGLLPDRNIDLFAYYENEQPAPLRMTEGGHMVLPDCYFTLKHRPSIRALLFGPIEIPSPTRGGNAAGRESFLWKDAGLAVLRNEHIRLAMRFGPYSGHHDHFDRLCVDVEAANGWQSLDLGTSGYGATITQWMRSPLAHNLVIINGAAQARHGGELIAFDRQSVEAKSKYGAVTQLRRIELKAQGWVDRYRISQKMPEPCLWAFHGDGCFELSDGVEVASSLEDVPKSEWLSNIRKVDTFSLKNGVLMGQWGDESKMQMRLSMPVPQGFDVYLAEAPGNPNGRTMGMVLVYGAATEVTFHAEFQMGAAGAEVG